MARFDLLVSRLPPSAHARVLQLARARRDLDERALASLIANPEAPATRVCVVTSLAAAEAVQAEFEQLGCLAVVVEHPSLLGELLSRMRAQTAARGATDATRRDRGEPARPPVPTPAAGNPAAPTAYRRLHGSTRDEIERDERTRRLRLQIIVGVAFACVVGVVGALLSRALTTTTLDPQNAAEQVGASGDASAVDRAAQASDRKGGSDDAPAEQEPSSSATDSPDRRTSTADDASGAAAPEAAAGPASTRPAGEQDGGPADARTDAEARPEDGSSPLGHLALIAIGLVAALVLLYVARRLAPPGRPEWVERVAAGGLGALSLVALIVCTLTARRPEGAAPIGATQPAAAEAQASGPTPSGSGEAALNDAVEASGAAPAAGAPPTVAAFVATLRRPEPAQRPFAAMADALREGDAEGSGAEGSGVGGSATSGSGASADGSDSSPSMARVVAGLAPPTPPCPTTADAPFAAMRCALERQPAARAAATDAGEPGPAEAGPAMPDDPGPDAAPSAPDGPAAAPPPAARAAGAPPEGAPPTQTPAEAPAEASANAPAADGADAAPSPAPVADDAPTPGAAPAEPPAPPVPGATRAATEVGAHKSNRAAQAAALALGALIGSILDLLMAIVRRLRAQEAS